MAGPESALRRALKLAGLSAGVAARYASYLAQHSFLREDERERKLKATHAKAGQRVTQELAALKGPAMKLGQALSLHTDLFPDEILQELSALQMSAPGMHPSLVRTQFKISMGRPVEEIFRSFDDQPFAAASLGQVHRAVTRDGKKVAVKIQYPGVREAVPSDFKLLRTFARTTGLKRKVPDAVLDEVEQHILAETDYRREAENIDFFRARLQPLDYVTVPQAYHEYSSDRVLTMSMVGGVHLQTYLSDRPPQVERDKLGAHLLELFYYQLLQIGAFHADPHWGNYLFGPNGAVGLVDFGCIKRWSPKFVEHLHLTFLYPGDPKSAEFRRLMVEGHSMHGAKLSPAALRMFSDLTDNFYRRVYPSELEKENEFFDFGEEAFLKEYMRHATQLFRAKGTLPEHVFLARAEIGLYQTLHRLQSRVQTSKIVRKFLRRRS